MNYRNTKQKNIILASIDKYGHLSVEQLKDLLNDENISISTIYRNLSILVKEGKIKKQSTNNNQVYETIKSKHHHFECIKCHKVIDIDTNLISIDTNHLELNITNTELFMYGICDVCKNNNE